MLLTKKTERKDFTHQSALQSVHSTKETGDLGEHNLQHVLSVIKSLALLLLFMYVFKCENMFSLSAEEELNRGGQRIGVGGEAGANQCLRNLVLDHIFCTPGNVSCKCFKCSEIGVILSALKGISNRFILILICLFTF